MTPTVTQWFNCYHQRPARIGHYEVQTKDTGKIILMYFGGVWWNPNYPEPNTTYFTGVHYQWRGLTEPYKE